MRSSKSRSRSKSNNRQRPLGNVLNRVFDSSGPEGKVRGTPQQIIDKYLMLARDAQLSNDRVAEQNFFQHAEHYTRMLGEAQREMHREQEMRQAQQDSATQNGGSNQTANTPGGNGGGDRQQQHQHQRSRYDDRKTRDGNNDRPRPDADHSEERDDGPGLVETPEMRQSEARESVTRAPMMPEMPSETASADTSEMASGGANKKPRAPRGPRKPKEKAEGAAPTETAQKPPADAAE